MSRFKVKDNKYYFQIDVLILSSRFILIIEVKNIIGTLIFDQTYNHQLIRVINGEEEGFQDPINQVKHQEFQLKRWLKAQKFPDIPVESLVIITNPNTIIKVTGGNPKTKLNVIKSTNILSEIEKLNEFHKEKSNGLKKHITKISNQLVKLHTPYNPDILNKFNISKKDITTGVFCENCSTFSLERVWGKWKCPVCFFLKKCSPRSNKRLLSVNRYINNEQTV
ncbi:MAG: nuclease-related domain-containing protein [Bacillota bacterium]